MDRAVAPVPDGERLDDPDAFAAFYERALPRVYGYVYHRVGGRTAIAEELTQETFLTVNSLLRRGQAVAAPLPWVFGIARHKLLEHYRREARAVGPLVSWESWQDDAEEPDGAAWDAPWEDDWHERTLRALAAVPAAQREALILRHMDGLSVPEVATALGRSVPAVESLLARGRATFKRRYAEAADAD